MHPNPSFRQAGTGQALAFARGRAFGMLIAQGDAAPRLSHVPFLLSDDGTRADLHLARSNPIARVCTAPLPITLAVTGPDGYVSPDWYGVDDQVPTWNYVAVHLQGTLAPLPLDALEPLVAAQSAQFEDFLPKTPWTLDKMTEDAKARMLRMILPFRLEIAEVESTFKLNQNKPDAVRLRAANAIEESFGSELAGLADLMRAPPQAD